jgi:CheY-like chemotaxis protein
MPKMNGIQTLKELKADDMLSKIPTFILTTAKSSEVEKVVKELGAVEYLVKPATYQEFVKLLDRCLTAHIGE